MLIHKDGRFFAGRSSFSLPDGCRINDAPFATLLNGINLKSEDEACAIDVNFEFGRGGAKKSLEDYLSQEDFHHVSIKSRPFPGGEGWCAEYCGELYKYFEARFDAPTGLVSMAGTDINVFRVVVTAPILSDIRTIRKSPVITGLLNSFLP